jgi:hypothetical protein
MQAQRSCPPTSAGCLMRSPFRPIAKTRLKGQPLGPQEPFSGFVGARLPADENFFHFYLSTLKISRQTFNRTDRTR